MRHHYSRHFFIFGILALLSLVASAPAYSEDRPNIVVIMADDLGWKDLHCYGNKLVDTVPLLEQTGELDRDSIYFHYPNYAFHKQNRLGSAIREGQHKLILHYDDGSVELYNLNTDMGEEKNLASEQPELAGRLRKKLDEWLLETGAKLPVRVTTP
jgi:arylsulfatase A-like enzyme